MSVNDFQWLQFTGSILGSGVVAAIVGYYTTRTKENREFKQKKLEELWSKYDPMLLGINELFIWTIATLDALAPFNPNENLLAAENNNKSSEIRLMISVYFGSLIPQYILLEKSRVAFLKLFEKYPTLRADIPSRYLAKLEFTAAHDSFSAAKHCFFLELVRLAIEIDNENLFSPIVRPLRKGAKIVVKWVNDPEQFHP